MLRCTTVLQDWVAGAEDVPLQPVDVATAVNSVRPPGTTYVVGCDSGMDGDVFTVLLETASKFIFDESLSSNRASHEQSAKGIAPLQLFSEFRHDKHALHFQLTSGLAKEAKKTRAEEVWAALILLHT